MYCRNWGKEVAEQAVMCVACGVPPKNGKKFLQLFLESLWERVDTHGQARGTFTEQASLDLNPGFPATLHI